MRGRKTRLIEYQSLDSVKHCGFKAEYRMPNTNQLGSRRTKRQTRGGFRSTMCRTFQLLSCSIFLAGFTSSALGLALPPPPPLKSMPLPAKLAGGLFLFQMSVKRSDKALCDEILELAQAQLRIDPLIAMELGAGLEAGGVFASNSSASQQQSLRQLVMEFQINGGNSWAQARVHGIKVGSAPARLVSLDVANMDASLMGGFAKVSLPPWDQDDEPSPDNPSKR
jgi:hypothetical protein